MVYLLLVGVLFYPGSVFDPFRDDSSSEVVCKVLRMGVIIASDWKKCLNMTLRRS